ncbi:hypothetical protein ACP6PL_19870 [Dapis sp. BLCC M126]|uniref:hypothetical protein n=1 Tax=Dapis sp. BLCC M126 TaxID=3400189 RepID=UPI003CF42B26
MNIGTIGNWSVIYQNEKVINHKKIICTAISIPALFPLIITEERIGEEEQRGYGEKNFNLSERQIIDCSGKTNAEVIEMAVDIFRENCKKLDKK